MQRLLVIQMLEVIFKNPQTLVDIFLNYDCDIKEKNIFERCEVPLCLLGYAVPVLTVYLSMVNLVSSISKAYGDSPGAQQEVQMRHHALECLVTILSSLVDWSKELAAPDAGRAAAAAAAAGIAPAEDGSASSKGARVAMKSLPPCSLFE
jgi:brefeldin A-inhibited guanine nucleotide-exchange protein